MVDELALEVVVIHQAAEQLRGFRGVGPVVARVVVVVVNPLYGVVVGATAVES